MTSLTEPRDLLLFDQKAYALSFISLCIPAIILFGVGLKSCLRTANYRISRLLGHPVAWVQNESMTNRMFEHLRFYIFGLILFVFVLAPYFLFLAWGIIAANTNHPKLVGLATIFLGSALIFTFYALLQWRAAGWRLQVIPMLLLCLSFICFLSYQIAVIFQPPFSFEATTTIFLTYNMIPLILMIYTSQNSDSKVDFRKFFTTTRASFLSISQRKLSLETIIADSAVSSNNTAKSMSRLAYIILLIVYGLIVVSLTKSADGKFVGFFVVATVIVFDLFNYVSFKNHLSPFQLIFFSSSLRLSFILWGAEYWFIAQSFGFFVLQSALSISIVHVHYPNKGKEAINQLKASFSSKSIDAVPAANEDPKQLNSQPQEPDVVPVQSGSDWRTKFFVISKSVHDAAVKITTLLLESRHLEASWWCLTAIFLIPLCLCATDEAWNPAADLIDGRHDQYVFGIAAILLSFSFRCGYTSLRRFAMQKVETKQEIGSNIAASASSAAGGTSPPPSGAKTLYAWVSTNKQSIAYSAASYIFIIICAAVLFKLTNSAMLMNCLLFIPPVAALTANLYRYWMKNDFDILDSPAHRPAVYRIYWDQVRSNIVKRTEQFTSASIAAVRAGINRITRKGQVAPAASAYAAPSASSYRVDDNNVTPSAEAASDEGKTFRKKIEMEPQAADDAKQSQDEELLPPPSMVPWYIGFYRGGLTTRDYLMLFGMSLNFFLICMYGLSVSLTFKSNSWVGWTISCCLITGLTTAYPIAKWFGSLHFDHTCWISLAISACTWTGYCFIMFFTTLKGDYKDPNSALLLFVFLMYPNLTLLVICINRWRDDGWKVSKFVARSSIATSVSIGVFFLLLTVLPPHYGTAGLLLLHVVFSAACYFAYRRLKYKLNPHFAWGIAAIVLIVAYSVIVGVFTKSFFAGLSVVAIACLGFTALQALRFFLFTNKDNVKFSKKIFPSFQYDTQQLKVVSAETPVLYLYGTALGAIFWGALATLFLSPNSIGIGVMCGGTFAICLFSIDRSFSSSQYFGHYLKSVKPHLSIALLASIRKKAIETCLTPLSAPSGSGNEDPEQASSNSLTKIGNWSNVDDDSYGGIQDDGGDDFRQQLTDLQEAIAKKQSSVWSKYLPANGLVNEFAELKKLDEEMTAKFVAQRQCDALIQFMTFHALKLKASTLESEINRVLKKKGVQLLAPLSLNDFNLWADEHRECVLEEVEELRRKRQEQADEAAEKKKKEDADIAAIQFKMEQALKMKLEEEMKQKMEEERKKQEDADPYRLWFEGFYLLKDEDKQELEEVQEQEKETEKERKKQEIAEQEVKGGQDGEGEEDTLDVPIRLDPFLRRHINAAKAKVNSLLIDLKESGNLYKDEEFPATADSLGPKVADKVHQWLRPSQIMENPRFILGGIDTADVMQGALGDCWFLSAVAALAQTPQRLMRIFLNPEYNKQGVYGFMFYIRGCWIDVIVDDQIPCDENGKPVFAHSDQRDELWMALLEKAFAKVYQRYQDIEAGLPEEACVDLSGGIGQVIHLQSPQVQNELMTGELWNQLVQLSSEQHLLSCSTLPGSDTVISASGTVYGHAYSVLKVKDVNGHKLLCLRNPWGSVEWNGDFSDNSPLWTKKNIARAGFSGAKDDGVFWIPFSDFLQHFSNVFVCYVFDTHKWQATHPKLGKWLGETAAGRLGLPNADKNPQYSLTISQRTKCVIAVSKMDKRGQSTKGFITHVKIIDNGGRRAKTWASDVKTLHQTASWAREVILEATLEAKDTPYTVFVSTENPKEECTFWIRVFYYEADCIDFEIMGSDVDAL